MTTLIRKLEKYTWMDIKKSKELGGLQGDALKNFRTNHNAISVYTLTNPEITVERIIAAIASGKEKLEFADYAIFDQEIVENLEIDWEEDNGTTGDSEVNELHLNLKNLTASKIKELASEIQKTGRSTRILSRKLGKEIKYSIDNGYLDVDKVNHKILSNIN